MGDPVRPSRGYSLTNPPFRTSVATALVKVRVWVANCRCAHYKSVRIQRLQPLIEDRNWNGREVPHAQRDYRHD
jgi:hypothetical protein